jgi:hypothetical protein
VDVVVRLEIPLPEEGALKRAHEIKHCRIGLRSGPRCLAMVGYEV